MLKRVPLRTCVITKEKCPKGELIRVVKDNKGNIFVDVTGKANGRGAYLKKDIDVINKARQGKQLNHHLGTITPSEVYDELENIINK